VASGTGGWSSWAGGLVLALLLGVLVRVSRQAEDLSSDTEGPLPAIEAHVPPSVEFHGRPVLDDELLYRVLHGPGDPAEGVTVTLYRTGALDEPLQEAVSDASGHVRFGHLHPDVRYRIRLKCDRGGTWFVPATYPSRVCQEVTVARRHGEGGEIQDAITGKAIVGARITCHWGPDRARLTQTMFEPGPVMSATVSDEFGTWYLPDVVFWAAVLVAEKPGYATARWMVWTWEEAAVLRLVPAGTVEGTVSSSGGAGVSGALVSATRVCAGPPWQNASLVRTPGVSKDWDRGHVSVFATESVRTDEKGAFRLPGLAAGAAYRIAVRAEGCREFSLGPVVVGPGEVRSESIHLRSDPPGAGQITPTAPVDARARVSGRVVDDAERPVEDALVTCEGARPARVRTDTEGRFTITVAPQEFRCIEVEAEGYGRGGCDREDLEEDLTIRLERRCRLRIPIAPQSNVESGARAEVRVYEERCGFQQWERIEDGEIALDLCADTREIVLLVRDRRAVTIPVELQPGRDEVTPPVRLEVGATLTVHVESDAGEALEGAVVSVWQPSDRGPEKTLLVGPGDRTDRVRYAPTGPAGVARIAGLVPGELTHLRVEGFGHLASETSLHLDGADGDLRVTLRRTVALRGAIVEPEGLPVGFARVSVVYADRGETKWIELLADHAGRFEVLLPPGRHELTIEPPYLVAGVTRTFPVNLRPGGGLDKQFVFDGHLSPW
jgi:hypothetical protein